MLEVANVTVCTRMDLYSSIDEKWQSSLSWVDLETLTALLVRASMSGEAQSQPQRLRSVFRHPLSRNDSIADQDVEFRSLV